MKIFYTKVRLRIPESVREYAVSVMLDIGFEGFQEEDDAMEAWIRSDRYSADVRKGLEDWLGSQPDECRILEEETVAERNWNEEWEKTIQPMQIGPFFIHPTWADESPPKYTIPIAIDPKMAFGTGYHETTRLMLRLIPDFVRKGDTLLDMGAGTGVLGIAALKMGAGRAVGIDIDPWSYDNALENAKINGLAERLEIRIGSVDQLKPDEQFNLILANINRNILLDLGDALVEKLATGGNLLLSGIVEGDEEVIFAHPAYRSLEKCSMLQENEWLGIGLSRIIGSRSAEIT